MVFQIWNINFLEELAINFQHIFSSIEATLSNPNDNPNNHTLLDEADVVHFGFISSERGGNEKCVFMLPLHLNPDWLCLCPKEPSHPTTHTWYVPTTPWHGNHIQTRRNQLSSFSVPLEGINFYYLDTLCTWSKKLYQWDATSTPLCRCLS